MVTKALKSKIETFLAERRESTGGWAEVQPVDVQQLTDIIRELITLKFAKDPDGDLPIECTLVDRTRFEPMHYRPVRYVHRVKKLQELRDALDLHVLNLEIAQGCFLRAHRVLREEEHAAEKEKKSVIDDRNPHDPVEFTESPEGERAKEKWAERYEECDGAPESDDDR